MQNYQNIPPHNLQITHILFIDEVQNLKGFEEVLNEYRDDGEYFIFITGSNSYLLSGELVTKLTGCYIEFEMFPLNFNEYLEMKSFSKKISAQIFWKISTAILLKADSHNCPV